MVRRGFTLVELLVVIAIIAMLVAPFTAILVDSTEGDEFNLSLPVATGRRDFLKQLRDFYEQQTCSQNPHR